MTGKILLIEDDNDLREEIADILTFAGYLVYTATDGVEGISLARTLNSDLIVCDVMMPGLDGYEVLDILRHGENPSDVPFLFLTAKSARDDMRRGMNLGADDYLTKPFSMDELTAAVAARLDRVELTQSTHHDKSETAKNTFMRMVAHELRTPVTAMTVSTELLLDEIDRSPGNLERVARIAHSGSKRLHLLVERMMMFMRYETDDIDIDDTDFLQEIQVQEVIKTAVEKAQALHADASNGPIDVRIILDHPEATVKATRQYIDYALAEVIANAFKFSDYSEPVIIRQWVKNGYVNVTVSNPGESIPYEACRLVMQPFTQVNRDKLEQQGVGIGLSLANRVVSALGGSIAIMPAPQNGTDCIISLPAV